MYEIKSNQNDWESILNATANYSKLLSNTYSSNTIYLNIAEALIVPAEKFRQESIEPYLAAVYGNENNYKCEADTIAIPKMPATIYRFSTNLNEAIAKRFNSYTYKHTYTKILENLLGNDRMLMEMLKVQVLRKNNGCNCNLRQQTNVDAKLSLQQPRRYYLLLIKYCARV